MVGRSRPPSAAGRALSLRSTAARRLAKNSPLDCFYPAMQGRSLGSAFASFWGSFDKLNHPRTLRAPTIPNVRSLRSLPSSHRELACGLAGGPIEVYMEELLNLLTDGRSRTIEMLAGELHTSTDDILRKIDFLERSKIIRRVATSYPENETLLTAGKKTAPVCSGHCTSCAGCSHGKGKSHCDSCMPKGGFKNMGIMWEVIK